MKAADITKVHDIPPAMLIGFTEALKQTLPHLNIVLTISDGLDAITSTTVSPEDTTLTAQGIIDNMKRLFSAKPDESATHH